MSPAALPVRRLTPTGYFAMNVLRVAVLVLSLASLPGCAAVALTAGGLAGAAGMDHTLSGIVYRTFAASMDETRAATLMTLERMGMEVTQDKKTEEGREILALAHDRTIDIELEVLTARTTRMRVVANKGEIFFKDSATATEIILQTALTLERELVSAH